MDTLGPNINKIAVLRANGLGDFVFVLPALQALRETYPDAEIVYLGKPWHQHFLSVRPSPVDRVIVVPPGLGVREEKTVPENTAELDRFFRKMQQEQFDLAFQMHGGGRNSNPFIRKLGAGLTIGSRTPDAPPLDRWIPYYLYHNEIMRYLEIAALAGATTQRLVPQITITSRDIKEVQQKVSYTDQPTVVLHPGASDLRRRWAPEKFAAVADILAHEGYRICITGVIEEKEVVAAVVHTMQHPVENLCTVLSTGGLAGLLSQAALLISNDTGPLHLAAAVGTNTVGIYWCGNMITAGQLTRMRHHPLISWQIICPLCHQNIAPEWPFTPSADGCQHDISFVDDVTVEQVLAAAHASLACVF
jgi:ADP-heptose:LPS heptosyltransferase